VGKKTGGGSIVIREDEGALRPVKSFLLAGCAAVGLILGSSGIAVAQDETAPPVDCEATPNDPACADQQPPAEEPAAEEEAAEEAATTERIIVTGSRIRKDEFTSSSPVQVITSEQSTLEGLVDTSEILQGSSLATGSQQINNQFTGFVTEGGPGANTISLRGLGAQRTIVLLNGRRLSPAGSRGQVGSVDLNVIPSSIIDRIEILKDGASSIYGSDAVAGVINVITNADLDGGIISANGNVTEHGGADTWAADGAWGTVFDRGQFMVSGEYFDREAMTWGQRDYLSCSQDIVSELGTGRFLDIIDPSTGQSKCFNTLENVSDRLTGNGGRFTPDGAALAGGGILPTSFGGETVELIAITEAAFGGINATAGAAGRYSDLAGLQRVNLSYANVIHWYRSACNAAANPLARAALGAVCTDPTAFENATEATWRQTTIDTPTNPERYNSRTAITPVQRGSLFATGSYDLAPSVEAYAEAMWNNRESEQKSWRQLFPNVNGANPNNSVINGGFATTARSIVLIPTDGQQTVDYYRGVVGLRGDYDLWFMQEWSYDVFYQWSYSDAEYTNDIIYNDRVLATTGALACNQAAITISGGNCADIPTGISWFSPAVMQSGVWPANQQAFLFTKETGTTTYEQSLIQGTITGDLFELPAGTLAVALGVEYREDEIDDTPGFNARNNNLWGQTSAGRTAGTDTTFEYFGEVEVPIVRGVSFFEDVTFNGSYRWTDVDSYGKSETWKMGLNWQMTPEYRLRATKGTSFRAPALYELFLANQTGFLGQAAIDPCILWELDPNPNVQANCSSLGIPTGYTAAGSSSALITTGGGAGILEPETSEADSVGFIWTPDFIDLSVAVDYFDIYVFDEVAQFGSANILQACFSDPNFPASPFCSLFFRELAPGPTQFNILTVNDSYVNINTQRTQGVDITARYEHEFSFGDLRIDGRGTWTFVDEFVLFFGDTDDFNGTIVDPDFSGELDFRFDMDDWTFSWFIDMYSKTSSTELFLDDVFPWRGTQVQPCPPIPAPNQCPFVPPAYSQKAIFAKYKQHTEFTAAHDFSIRYRMDTWSFQVGVQNVFDEAPPTLSTGSFFGRIGNMGTGTFDPVGRRGFFEIIKTF
jgi:iron complex outermembrane recepter protein